MHEQEPWKSACLQMISSQQKFEMLILPAAKCSPSSLKHRVISWRQTRASKKTTTRHFKSWTNELGTTSNLTLDSGKGFAWFPLGPPRKPVTQRAVPLPHIPDKIFEGAEGDHSTHPLARRGEGVVQQHVTHAGDVNHPVVVEVGREGHSKRQRKKVTVSGDGGEIGRGKTSEHVRLLWPLNCGCLSRVTVARFVGFPARQSCWAAFSCGPAVLACVWCHGCSYLDVLPDVQEQEKVGNNVTNLWTKCFLREFIDDRWITTAKLNAFFLLYVQILLYVWNTELSKKAFWHFKALVHLYKLGRSALS